MNEFLDPFLEFVDAKKMLTVKKSNHKIEVTRPFVESDVLCVYVFW